MRVRGFAFPEPNTNNEIIMNNTIEMPRTESVHLHYREGASDKVYHVTLEPKGDGFTVDFTYGRRGTALNTGTKTREPVDYDQAKRIYDKLVRSKLAKGYTAGRNGTPYQHSDKAGRFTGILPQLLNPIDETAVAKLIDDDAWCLQEQIDGRRMLLKNGRDAVTTVINRRGLIVGGADNLVREAHGLPGEFLLDGECVGERYIAFDLLEIGGRDIRPEPYETRLVELMNLLASAQHPSIDLVDTAFDPATKLRTLRELRAAEKEGIVLKRLAAPYTPGRPNSGGDQLKHKFYSTLSAVVAHQNPQRSVEIRLFGDMGWVPAGNVTIPPNHDVPGVGEIIEVRFLYAFRESGVLYQPVFLCRRFDIAVEDCTVGQLKFKPEESE